MWLDLPTYLKIWRQILKIAYKRCLHNMMFVYYLSWLSLILQIHLTAFAIFTSLDLYDLPKYLLNYLASSALAKKEVQAPI